MNKLLSFEICNYRSCLKTKLDLSENLMCLIGINGAGKSNILNGIQLLKKIKGTSRYSQKGTLKSLNRGSLLVINSEIKLGDNVVFIKAQIVYETDDKNNDEVLESAVKFNLKQITNKSKWIEVPGAILDYLTDGFAGPSSFSFLNIKLTSLEVQTISAIRDFLKKISYYSASQFSDPSKSPISLELEDSRPYRVRMARGTEQHEKFLSDLYAAYKNNNKLFNKFLSTVNKEGIGIVDNLTFSQYEMPSSIYEVKSGGKIKKIERNRQLIIPFITIDEIQLSPNQLSEGTYKTLALIFYVITDENNLLLIEEPEVCVHHGLLNSILTLIISQSKKKQIIISTHSDFVLDHLQPEDVIIVKREPGIGTISKALPKSMSKNDYKALKKYLLESGNLGEYWKEGGFENE